MMTWVVILTASLAWAQYSAQPTPEMWDPNEPTKTRTLISRVEREKLGLNPRTWDGVVHPQVANTLSALIKEPKDPTSSAQFRSRIPLEGTVYVQVQLKHTDLGRADSPDHKAAIAVLQHRLLQSLTAAEFHPVQLFETVPGFVGYASQSAVTKLAEHGDILGVCLDNHPIPERLKVRFKDDLPPAKPGECEDEPGVREGKIEADAYRSVKLDGRAFVCVALAPRDGGLPQLTSEPSEKQQRWQDLHVAVRNLQDQVLSKLPADNFWLNVRFDITPAFCGYADHDGLEKLSMSPVVKSVALEHRVGLSSPSAGKP